MAVGTGYFLIRGDETTYGGKITEGTDDHTIMGIPQARNVDRVTCGRYPGMFIIVDGVPETDIHGRLIAGTLNSQSSCPCKARFITLMMDDTYETDDGRSEAEQHTQSAKRDLTSGFDSSSDNIKLDYRIKLSNNKILTPLDIPDYKEMISGGSTKSTEKIDFTITNKGDEAEALSLGVLDGSEVIYNKRQTDKYCDREEHTWQWDDYSGQGILDTTKIKGKSSLVRLIASCGDMMIEVDYPLHNSPEEQKWVDVKVNKKQKTVDIIWRLAVSDGGIEGGSPKLSPVPYSDLVNLTKNGVEFYWSRNGSRGGKISENVVTSIGALKVNVKAEMNVTPPMRTFSLISSSGPDFQASISLSGFEKMCYNYGDSYKDIQDKLQALLDANSRYKRDNAHEMRHKVLDEYGEDSSPGYS